MRQASVLAALAAALFLPQTAPAGESASHSGVRSAQARTAKPHSVILSVTSSRPVPAEAQAAHSGSGRTRLVSIDGVLVEMAEEFIRGQIEAGVFTVVHPGTTTPWTPGDDRHPNYPPDWF